MEGGDRPSGKSMVSTESAQESGSKGTSALASRDIAGKHDITNNQGADASYSSPLNVGEQKKRKFKGKEKEVGLEKWFLVCMPRENEVAVKHLPTKPPQVDNNLVQEVKRTHEKVRLKWSRLSKLRAVHKIRLRSWKPVALVETRYIKDAPHPRRPKTSTSTALFIVQTITKNFTPRGWLCACIVAEVTGTPDRQPISPSTVYGVLTENGYGVSKRTTKPGLTEENKKARPAWCLKDKGSGTIWLIHYTTQEYFQRTRKEWFPHAKTNVTTICVTYLSFETIESGFCETDAEYEKRLQLNHFFEYAVQDWGREAVAQLPVERGADIDSKDRYGGQTPLSIAAENGHEFVVPLPRSYIGHSQLVQRKFDRTQRTSRQSEKSLNQAQPASGIRESPITPFRETKV